MTFYLRNQTRRPGMQYIYILKKKKTSCLMLVDLDSVA